METRKIIEKSIGSNQITVVTNKLPEISITEINPYEPFKGEDGNTYSIEYDNRLNGYTNCYAFAMGWLVEADNKYDDYIPGFLVGKPFSVENSANLVKADLEQVGRKVYEIIYNVPKQLPDGDGYWIKFLYRPGKNDLSSHFMRKDKKSGRWIHKMGWYTSPKVCVRNLEFGDKIVKCEIETNDSAGYISYSQSEGVKKYVTLWAMRVSEP
ncbi:MAG: hypothetical protein IKL55_04095 [Clostridia bacterium]|nr:hypothetical protein [Clostridia bacterium]